VKHIRVTAAVICRDGAYLLGRRSRNRELPGKWEFPGGKIEPGESPETCLTREILEELGLEARVGERVGVFEYIEAARRIELIAFYTEVESGPPSLNDHDEVSWVGPHSLLDYDLAPADIELARRLAGEIRHKPDNPKKQWV